MNDKDNTNILKQIMQTIRTESRELTDAVFGSFGIGKIEQEHESAELKLNQAKTALTEMMTKQRQSSRILEFSVEKINQLESLIMEALDQGDKAEAMKCALEVVDLEVNRNIQVESIIEMDTQLKYLQRQLEQSERDFKEVGRQLNMLKTNEKVQKATETIMENIEGADTNLMSAKMSLDRLRQNQKNKDNPLNLAPLMSDSSQLKSKTEPTRKTIITLDSVDSSHSAEDIIKRLQDKI